MEEDPESVDTTELDIRMARFGDLMDRRPFLVNDVLLRQNPNNVHEWQKRVALYEDNPQKVRNPTTPKTTFTSPEKEKKKERKKQNDHCRR